MLRRIICIIRQRVLNRLEIHRGNGSGKVTKAQISGLRLMRATSSYLVNYSRLREGVPESRLGLAIGAGTSGPSSAPKVNGVAEYVLGGWCIGTVLDSAASRATVNGTVRTAPASMAMNVNVNVEWWSADKLHHHYNDPPSALGDAVAGVLARTDAQRRDGKMVTVAKDGVDVDVGVTWA